jgi:hypothetical protein
MTAAALNLRVLAIAFMVGAMLLATPIGFIILKQNPYFDQTRPGKPGYGWQDLGHPKC